jgi:hypothetical protein
MKNPYSVPAVALRARARGPLLALCVSGAWLCNGQTTIDLRTQTRNVDFSGAVSTRPVKTGTALPATCAAGEIFFKTTAAAGRNLYTCAPANQWSAIAGTAAGGGGNYAASFSGQTSVPLEHNLNTAAVTVQCFDSATPPALLEANRVTVADANRVDVTFIAAQSGTCVVSGGGTGGGTTGAVVAAGDGLLSSGGVVRVNPAAVRSYLSGSESLAFGTIAGSGGCASRTMAVAGATIGDRVTVGMPTELMTYSLAVTYAVTGAGTVAIRLCNYTGSAITPPSWTWNVDVVKSF